VTVIGVLTETDVGDHVHISLALDPTSGFLHDAVLGPRAATLGIFGLGDAEEDHRLDARCPDLFDAGNGLGDRDALLAGHRLDGHPFVDGRVDEDGSDEIARLDARLAH